jgi:hypothetical protein
MLIAVNPGMVLISFRKIFRVFGVHQKIDARQAGAVDGLEGGRSPVPALSSFRPW